jgi:ribosomal protein S18 acetylase RimI-like enzyme
MNEIKEEVNNIAIEVVEKLDGEQQKAVKELQKLAFAGVDDEEAKKDFYHPASAQVLAYIGKKLIGWAGIHEAEQDFEGKKIKLGGYGLCTHPEWQRRGIAGKVSQAAMNFLRKKGCEVAFLSVDPSNTASVRLHQKNGFVMLPRDFSWTNSRGETKRDSGGMIAPVNSRELFERILNGKEVLFVGNGYW